MTTTTPPSYNISNVSCLDLAKSSDPISTGIGFFDHMIDQLNSHAQVGVSVVVSLSSDDDKGDKNRFAEPMDNQCALASQVGSAMGTELSKIIEKVSVGSTSRFCCPLDEGLVECILTKSENGGSLTTFTLPPYGIYPSKTGRTKIGQMSTAIVQPFFQNLAVSSGLTISLHKVRGDNGHHVVESAFKAFSRALRNMIDGTDTSNDWSASMEKTWGKSSQSYKDGIQLQRGGIIQRQTKETSIDVMLQLDGTNGSDKFVIDTGLNTLNTFVTSLAKEADVSLNAVCKGDLWVDDHHTSEDVAIALGQVLNKALGTKAGLNRMWCAVGGSGDAQVEVTMDLSNRPCLTSNLSLSNNEQGEEYVGDMSIEMFAHALESLVMNGQMTVHIVENNAGKNLMETVVATAIAFGRALRLCAAVDPRRAGKTASSKGTLSV
mmetsp:Transcript_15100/g.22047  ORF Transcript_15100/g.22047 Transcript_15100/m.22047 type:complete len:434 (+) Transcript_15100:53-1354(+)